MDIALFLVRLIVGLAIARHGTEKLFGWFGGYGIAGTAGFFEQLGWRPGRLFVLAAAGAEIGGGLLTILGLGGPLGPALIVMVMLVAIFTVHVPKGFWQSNGGYELNAMNVAAALAIGFAGPGPYSLDAVLGIAAGWTDELRWIVFGLAVVLALFNLAVRRTAPKAQTA